jgi:hypothetical protein
MTDEQASRPLGREILGFTVAEWLESGALSTREMDVLLEAQSAGGYYAVGTPPWLVLARLDASHARRVLKQVAEEWRRLIDSPPPDLSYTVFAHASRRDALLDSDRRFHARLAEDLATVERLASGGR